MRRPLWVLILALEVAASPSGVFASSMIATLLRAIGLLPGGLGTFEATSVLALKLVGVPLPVVLSSTLLFRGLSFWLPMIPGLWFSRRAPVRNPAGGHTEDDGRYWAFEPAELFQRLQTGPAGLSSTEAVNRLRSVRTQSDRSALPQSFLFALALAVGLTPELLPLVVSVPLAHGAIRISRKGLTVKRFSAITISEA